MKKQNVRTLSLIVCTFTYLLVGAAVFDALESKTEIEVRSDVWQIFLVNLQTRESVNHTRTELQNRYNITDTDYAVIEQIIVASVPHKAGHQWKFAGAFYFSTTVITTIGYGHSTPATVGGKLFCMLYALAGIPLGLVMFQSIGERLNTLVAFVLTHIKRLVCGRCAPGADQVTHTDLVCIAFLTGTLVTTAGAYAFAQFENWTYFDALYYCFITLTTIGFGDYVALQQENALHKRPEYVAFSLIFILFGLTVLSAAMNLLVLRFLTMNTEDERRDERQARLAAKGLVKVDGDIITGGGVAAGAHGAAAPSAVKNQQINDTDDGLSVCSCTCYQLPYTGIGHTRRHPAAGAAAAKCDYTVTRRPADNVTHLIQHTDTNQVQPFVVVDAAETNKRRFEQ